MTRKNVKIHGLDKVMENVTEEQRATLAAEVEEELSDFDPDDPSAEPVLPVPPGTRTCPTCSGNLVELGFIPNPQHETICILECESCDATFCEGSSAQLQ